MDEKGREGYIEWIAWEVKLRCDGDGRFPVCWGRRDSVDPDMAARAIEEYRGAGFETPADWIEDRLYGDLAPDLEGQFLSVLEDDLAAIAPEAVRGYHDRERGGLFEWDDIYEAGYRGLDMDIEGLLSRSRFHVDLVFATPAELNRDMTSIASAFDPGAAPDGEDLDNALSYLLNQQGRGVAEVFGGATGGLIDSVREELADRSEAVMGGLCALLAVDGDELLRLGLLMGSGSGAVTIPRDAVVGVFDPRLGEGGPLGIELERDAVMPIGMVSHLQIEGCRDRHGLWQGWTVDEVYGLVGSAWREVAAISPYTPDDPREDYTAAARALRETPGGHVPNHGELMAAVASLRPAGSATISASPERPAGGRDV